MPTSQPTNLYMYMYNNNSQGGNLLKDELGALRIRHENSTFRGSPDKVVINWGWGGSLPSEVARCKVINGPASVAIAINKIDTFETLGTRVRTVPWTRDRATALGWLREGYKVVVRTRVEGRAGQGISIINPTGVNSTVHENLSAAATYLPTSIMDRLRRSILGLLEASPGPTLPQARLYTKFVPYTREYRVHVVGNRAVNVRRKIIDEVTLTRGDIPDVNEIGDFRNVAIYPDDIVTQSVLAVQCLGLDFGAVDVLWDNRQAWVLEVNTAPGIGGITVSRYAEALRELISRKYF